MLKMWLWLNTRGTWFYILLSLAGILAAMKGVAHESGPLAGLGGILIGMGTVFGREP